MTKYFFGEREFIVFPHCDNVIRSLIKIPWNDLRFDEKKLVIGVFHTQCSAISSKQFVHFMLEYEIQSSWHLIWFHEKMLYACWKWGILLSSHSEKNRERSMQCMINVNNWFWLISHKKRSKFTFSLHSLISRKMSICMYIHT